MVTHVAARHWWMFAIRGGLAILFGLLALIWPLATILALALLFGAYMLIDGVLAGWYGVRERRGWWIVQGIVGLAVGAVAILLPGITAIALLYLIALWAIVRGIAELIIAVGLLRLIGQGWLLATAGAVSIVFGVLAAFFPAAGIFAIIWLIGLYAIVLGVLLAANAIHLHGWRVRSRSVLS
ncbi:MAG TPA: DUF308 domain-containing protein [Candidatus Dormibacteraeota bacterium]|nr:DUF308 domain-containing protein [Candidatus Dormibacteraeota bacterium]